MLPASCILILLGGLCLLGGKVWQIFILKEEQYKGKAVGTVAEVIAGEPDKAGILAGIHDYYYPIIAFYAGGHLYKLKYHKGSNPSIFQIRQKVNVCYDEKDPTRFEIYTRKRSTTLAITMYYLGFVFCCVGGILFLLFATRY